MRNNVSAENIFPRYQPKSDKMLVCEREIRDFLKGFLNGIGIVVYTIQYAVCSLQYNTTCKRIYTYLRHDTVPYAKFGPIVLIFVKYNIQLEFRQQKRKEKKNR